MTTLPVPPPGGQAGADGKPAPRRSTVREALSLPPRWLGMYGDFISKNASQVSQIESALRSLTYIIPGRFRDAEIASETLHSGVQLLSLYHDAILRRGAAPSPSSSSSASASPSTSQQLPPPPPLPHRTMHARYTAFWSTKSALYRRVALALQVVQYTQLLIEMAAKRRGDERLRWRVVVLVEAFKAFCKLVLMRITRSRPLLTPALPERVPVPAEEDEENEEDTEFRIPEEFRDESEPLDAEEDGVSTEGQNGHAVAAGGGQNGHAVKPGTTENGNGKAASAAGTAASSQSSSSHTKDWHMPRTNSTLPSLPSNSDISSYLLSRVLTADDIKPAPRLLRPLSGSAQAAEVLHIIAPLVYAMALAHFSLRRAGNKSSSTPKTGSRGGVVTTWAPWVLGVALSLAARRLRDRGLRTTALEREEWTRRGWSLGWWAMRGAAYEGVMKGVVQGVRKRVPGFVGGILEDYEYLWENYYFSTAD